MSKYIRAQCCAWPERQSYRRSYRKISFMCRKKGVSDGNESSSSASSRSSPSASSSSRSPEFRSPPPAPKRAPDVVDEPELGRRRDNRRSESPYLSRPRRSRDRGRYDDHRQYGRSRSDFFGAYHLCLLHVDLLPDVILSKD